MTGREVSRRGEYILRLSRGEDVVSSILDFCMRKGIRSAWLSAIGAVEAAKIGSYDLSKKTYVSKSYLEAHEIVSLTGNIALVEGAPFLHAHAVLSNEENECAAGHLFSARVAVTLEVRLIAFDEAIARTLDNDIGLRLLDL